MKLEKAGMVASLAMATLPNRAKLELSSHPTEQLNQKMAENLARILKASWKESQQEENRQYDATELRRCHVSYWTMIPFSSSSFSCFRDGREGEEDDWRGATPSIPRILGFRSLFPFYASFPCFSSFSRVNSLNEISLQITNSIRIVVAPFQHLSRCFNFKYRFNTRLKFHSCFVVSVFQSPTLSYRYQIIDYFALYVYIFHFSHKMVQAENYETFIK